MNLAEYIQSYPRGMRSKVRKELAEALGVSEVYIRSMSNGNKPIPGIHALTLERITKGLVPKSTSCPTLFTPDVNTKPETINA